MKLSRENLDTFRHILDRCDTWEYTVCSDYGDFQIDIYEALSEAAKCNNFDREYILYFDGFNEFIDLYEIAFDYADNYDPTPYCGICHAQTKAACDCP